MTNLSGADALFTYGSLMCADIMAAVAGATFPAVPAVLPGFCRLCVRDEQYPGVVPAEHGTVAGIVYHGLGPGAWSRLDRFEGEMYVRLPVLVRNASGCEARVQCYVVRPEFRDRLTAGKWDPAAFQNGGKALFLAQYQGFQAID